MFVMIFLLKHILHVRASCDRYPRTSRFRVNLRLRSARQIRRECRPARSCPAPPSPQGETKMKEIIGKLRPIGLGFRSSLDPSLPDSTAVVVS